MSEQFDVFLCHNGQDKSEVKKIAEKLKQKGLKPWLDVWELPPGQSWQELLEEQIEDVKSAAVFVGSSGFGPWQELEMRAFLSEFVNRGCPVIPVLLENAPQKPELPIFLKALTWVDFRHTQPDPMGRLIWGITGDKPDKLHFSQHKSSQEAEAPSLKELTLAQRLKKESLEKRLAVLEENYQALERDYREAGDADERNRLQSKLDRKLEEIEEITQELNQINNGE